MGFGSTWKLGSQFSHDGKYQLVFPSSCMLAGTKTERTMVASARIATPSPKPICSNITSFPLANPPNTATIIRAAPVMSLPGERGLVAGDSMNGAGFVTHQEAAAAIDILRDTL